MLAIPDVTVVAATAPDTDRRHAHTLLLEAVSEALGHDPATIVLAHHCRRCGSADHGVPMLFFRGTPDRGTTYRSAPVPLAVSVSRAPGIVLAGWGTVPAIGVDIERAGSATDAALDRVLRHAGEPAPIDADQRTRAWVRKEAALKAWGTGLNVEPGQVQVAGSSASTVTEPHPVDLIDLAVPGYEACLGLVRHR